MGTKVPWPRWRAAIGGALTWENVRDYAYLVVGTAVLVFSMDGFLIPAGLAAGGVSGLAQVVNRYTGWPIGLMTFAANVPLFVMGWRHLGGPRFAVRTALVIVLFSALVDGLAAWFPPQGLTQDLVLNTLYGGVLGGIGAGLIYRGRGTSGGTDILARILSQWWHIPLAQSYLYADALVILLAGMAFGWERALYALLALYISGLAAEATLSGPQVVRVVIIVTDRPQEVTRRILHGLNRGVTLLEGRGGYTGEQRAVLYCVVTRAEVEQLKGFVREADPRAFMVVGQAHEALGEGFRPWEG